METTARRHPVAARLALRIVAVCAGSAGLASCSVPAAEAEPDVVVDAGRSHQVLEGFGASLAWYQGTLVTHARADEIYEHAFAELGLDILRLRNRFQRTSEGSSLSAETTIIERATASLGHPPRVLLASWSPPGPLKTSGREDCTGNGAQCTLVRDEDGFAYAAFAAYWADSLEAYRTAGIEPEWISIQNEPDFTPPSWEGCRFTPAETAEYPGYAPALAAVAAELAARGDETGLIGPETQGVHYQRVEGYLAELDPSLLTAVAHHLYERGSDEVWDWRYPGPDSYVAPMRGAATAAGELPVFQTEFQTDEDQFVDGGFETAWLIHNSLVEEGVAAFLYWDLVWDHSGLIAFDGGDYVLRDQYYAVRHFARFTDPGDVRVGVDSTVLGLRASAFRSPGGDRVTTVLLNVGAEARTVVLDPGELTAVEAVQSVFEPGQSELWIPLGEPDGELTLPPRSVTTVVAR